MALTMSPRKQAKVPTSWRLPADLIKAIAAEAAARKKATKEDWTSTDVAEEALRRGLKSMERERKKNP